MKKKNKKEKKIMVKIMVNWAYWDSLLKQNFKNWVLANCAYFFNEPFLCIIFANKDKKIITSIVLMFE